MEPSSRFDDFVNRWSDRDWNWWPLVRLRPAKTQRITLSRTALMSVLYGLIYGALTVVPLAVLAPAQLSRLHFVMLLYAVTMFVVVGGFTRPPWNRRSDRLSAGSQKQ